MTSDQDRQAGFSLLEAVLAISIAITVIGAVFTVLGPSRGIVEAQPEFADMQQRLRVGVDILLGDLMMAGAGAYAGTHTGSLVGQFAPILPFRRGSSAAYDDGPGVFRADAVTIAYVPSTSSQTILRGPMTDVTSVEVDSESGCPVNDPPCGFKPGTSAIVYDGTGAFDAFSVTNSDAGGTLTLQPMQQGSLATTYAAGAKIVEVVRHAYFLDGRSQQLMRYDGLAAAAARTRQRCRAGFPLLRGPRATRVPESGPGSIGLVRARASRTRCHTQPVAAGRELHVARQQRSAGAASCLPGRRRARAGPVDALAVDRRPMVSRRCQRQPVRRGFVSRSQDRRQDPASDRQRPAASLAREWARRTVRESRHGDERCPHGS